MRLLLDDAQSRVLDHGSGSLVVTGAPGSGKTAVLRERFARLVEDGADPERVALFVLNRRAARESRDALLHRLGRSLPDLPVFTAHGFGFRMAGRYFKELGYAEPPQVLSAPEQYAVVRGLLLGDDPKEWPRFGTLLEVPAFAREVADFVLRAQERLLGPKELEPLIQERDEYGEVVGFYRRYLDALSAAGQTDFAGLLFQTVGLLERNGERFDHVLADDYQDVTHAADGIVGALARSAGTVVVAADPGAHVFAYRGGSLEPFRRIAEGRVERVALDGNHRPAAPPLVSLDDPEGPPAASPPPGVEARLFAHPGEEAEALAHELLRWRVDEDVPWERMAVVLRRYGAYLTAVRHALARHDIPFVVVAEQAAVAAEPVNRPVIDLLRYVFGNAPGEGLLESILVSPIGGLHAHALRELRREARRREIPLHDLVTEVPLEELPEDVRDSVGRLRDLMARMPAVAEKGGPDGLFFWLWTTLPWFRDLAADGERQRDLDALTALGHVLAGLVERRPEATVQDYLETLEAAGFGPDPWVPPEERRPQAVRIVSAHRAQGLEFDVVLVAGCLEGEFPSLAHAFPTVDLEALVAPVSPTDRLRARLAEERALFRLAVSRARRATMLFASESTGAREPRTPSRFAARLGLGWAPSEPNGGPETSVRTMEAALRRRLADRTGDPATRVAALATLPSVAARPETWWWCRDWTDPGTPLTEGELRTSYSRLSTLQNCGLQYLYGVELGLDPDASYQMWMGKLVHDIIDRVHQKEIARTPEAVLEALDAGWESHRFPNRAIEHRRYLDARDMLERWLRHEQPDPEKSEVWFEFPIGGGVMRGRIDAVFRMENQHLRVVDYKTGRYAMTTEEAKRDLQLGAYYLALKRDPNLAALGEPAFLELAYLGKVDRREGFARRQASPKLLDDYQAGMERTIAELLERVRAEDFSPSPTADCKFCSFKKICPIWPEGQEVSA